MNSPLRLEHYFFERMHCEAVPEFEPSPGQPIEPTAEDFSVRVGLAQNPEEPHQYQIRLIVSDNAEANADRPYRLDFAAVGFFEIDQDFEHNDIERLVRINGSSVLYSALRELVLIITSRSAWGPITLPTINFRLTELGVAEGE